MLGSDGPNVSTTVWWMINKATLYVGCPGLLNIGMYTLHVVHYAFAKGRAEYATNVPEFDSSDPQQDLLTCKKYRENWGWL